MGDVGTHPVQHLVSKVLDGLQVRAATALWT
jgi:hypothetical protein